MNPSHLNRERTNPASKKFWCLKTYKKIFQTGKEIIDIFSCTLIDWIIFLTEYSHHSMNKKHFAEFLLASIANNEILFKKINYSNISIKLNYAVQYGFKLYCVFTCKLTTMNYYCIAVYYKSLIFITNSYFY